MTAIFNGNDSVDKDEDKSDLLSTTVQAVPHIPGAEMVGTNSEESSEERTSEEEAPEEEQEEIASCTETDSGYASYAGGTMTHTFSHISSPVTDYCIDDNTVMEYYCSPTLYPTDPANQRNFHESNCPYGCTTDANGGRCLYESEVQAPTEEGAPEEEAEPQGAAEPPAEENGPTNTYAFCIGKVEGMHCTIDSGIVATVPCDGNGNLGGATVICQSPEVCTEDVGQGNAECSEEPLAEEEPTAPICTDTDGGNEPTVSGITEGVRGSMGLHVDEDICSGTLGVNRRLREYYCVDDINSDFDWYYCECVDVDGNGQSVPGYCP